MKYIKTLGLAVVAAAALMAIVGAGSASATVICKNNTTPCTSKLAKGEKIHAVLESASATLVPSNNLSTTTCTGSTIEGEVSNEGSATTTAEGPILSLTFTGCNNTVHVLKTGTLVAHYGSTMGGTLTATGFEVTVEASGVDCIYSGTVSTGITFKGSHETGSTSTVEAVNASVPVKAGQPFLCGSSGKWTANYSVTTPDTLNLSGS
jgi:hypothetical protein